MKPAVGVLALQGDFAAHAAALDAAGAAVREVRHAAQIDALAGLIVPGGESTTLLHLMRGEPWLASLEGLRARGGFLLGTCAGAILFSRRILHPERAGLGLLDAVADRNAYGRQIDSFEAAVDVPELGGRLEGVFIRAPRLTELGADVEVLGSHGGEPVLVRQGRVWAATFHPELSGDLRLHRRLVDDAMASGTLRAVS